MIDDGIIDLIVLALAIGGIVWFCMSAPSC